MATQIDVKALLEQAEGRREAAVPVYHFGGGVVKYERANHNPFAGIELDESEDE
ncbi:MAG: hypothetical protein ACJA1I_000509 [Zhongshania marina]|jgi:hypothetical protein